MTQNTDSPPGRQFLLRSLSERTSKEDYRQVCEKATEIFFNCDDPGSDPDLAIIMDRMKRMTTKDSFRRSS